VGATHAEKSTGRAGQMNAVSSGLSAAIIAPQATTSAPSSLMAAALASQAELAPSPATDIKFCAIDDPGCEACQ
jgi:ribonucleoside-diphosphate reductase alpha chain